MLNNIFITVTHIWVKQFQEPIFTWVHGFRAHGYVAPFFFKAVHGKTESEKARQHTPAFLRAMRTQREQQEGSLMKDAPRTHRWWPRSSNEASLPSNSTVLWILPIYCRLAHWLNLSLHHQTPLDDCTCWLGIKSPDISLWATIHI